MPRPAPGTGASLLDAAPPCACSVAKARAARGREPLLVPSRRCLCAGGSVPAGEACLLLRKQDLSVGLGRNKKAMYERCPRLRAEVGLAGCVRRS